VVITFKISILSRMLVAHPVILGTQEAEIRRIEVQSQPRQIVLVALSQKTHHKNRAGIMAQG
jgi:hypothetical protein